ncbi:hypothetical protein DVH24_017957, partial [Malus domestica]
TSDPNSEQIPSLQNPPNPLAFSAPLASPSSPSVAPRALNAINLDLDVKYKSYLDEWESHPNVKCVLVDSRSACAFCGALLAVILVLGSLRFRLPAGGDVKQTTAKNQPPNMIVV